MARGVPGRPQQLRLGRQAHEDCRKPDCRAGDKDTGGALPALFQPFIHDQVICLAAPALAIFGADGQVRGIGAQGVYVADRRVLRMLVLRVGGDEPEPIGCMLTGPGVARMVSVHRSGDELTPDPVVILERVRDMRTLKEQLSVRNRGRHPVTLDLDMEVAADFAPAFVIKVGDQSPACLPSLVPAGIRFHSSAGTVTVTAQPPPNVHDGHLRWRAEVAPGAEWTAERNARSAGCAVRPLVWAFSGMKDMALAVCPTRGGRTPPTRSCIGTAAGRERR